MADIQNIAAALAKSAGHFFSKYLAYMNCTGVKK
jgi:hypothetical protein